MKKSLLKISLLAFALAFSVSANATDRDPFSPTGNGSGNVVNKVKDFVATETGQKPSVKNFDTNNPLTSMPLNGYKVIGTIISDPKQFASIKAVNGVNYLVTTGDSLGSEGGKVSKITLDEVTIQTESQDIKMPVSNKVEVPVEKAQ